MLSFNNFEVKERFLRQLPYTFQDRAILPWDFELHLEDPFDFEKYNVYLNKLEQKGLDIKSWKIASLLYQLPLWWEFKVPIHSLYINFDRGSVVFFEPFTGSEKDFEKIEDFFAPLRKVVKKELLNIEEKPFIFKPKSIEKKSSKFNFEKSKNKFFKF